MAHFNDVIDNGASLPVEHPVWEDIQHGAVLSVSIADADAICERIGLDNWVTLIHTLQLGLEEALSQERYHLQTRRGDDGAVTVAMVQPATTPDRALTLLAGGFLVMQSLDGHMLYPGTAEPVRLQATLHAGPYLRAMSAHSGWAYYLTGAAVEKVYELDAGNQAGGIQVSPDALLLLGPHAARLPPHIIVTDGCSRCRLGDSAHAPAAFCRKSSSVFEYWEPPQPQLYSQQQLPPFAPVPWIEQPDAVPLLPPRRFSRELQYVPARPHELDSDSDSEDGSSSAGEDGGNSSWAYMVCSFIIRGSLLSFLAGTAMRVVFASGEHAKAA